MNIYVGNISYSLTPEELKEAFAPFGNVVSVKIITDRETGKSKGYGFVEFENEEVAQKAIEGMHDQQFKGRSIKVNHAHRKPSVV